MRTTQFIGLSEKAKEYVEEYGKKGGAPVCPHCGGLLGAGHLIKREWSTTFGMFDEEIPLYEYELRDGRVLRETVQEIVWSSGPCIFTCLAAVDNESVKIGQWTYKEMEKYL